jgi:hypothetical protein
LTRKLDKATALGRNAEPNGLEVLAVFRRIAVTGLALLMVAAASPFLGGRGNADAAIHEIIAAACRAGGEEVVPPGQVKEGGSFLRALQATGVITSIDTAAGDGDDIEISFDLSRPNAKYKSAGFDLTIPDFFGPGVDLILSPLPVLDEQFPAHANCRNLNP